MTDSSRTPVFGYKELGTLVPQEFRNRITLTIGVHMWQVLVGINNPVKFIYSGKDGIMCWPMNGEKREREFVVANVWKVYVPATTVSHSCCFSFLPSRLRALVLLWLCCTTATIPRHQSAKRSKHIGPVNHSALCCRSGADISIPASPTLPTPLHAVWHAEDQLRCALQGVLLAHFWPMQKQRRWFR